jgi:predicted transcriptional regulator
LKDYCCISLEDNFNNPYVSNVQQVTEEILAEFKQRDDTLALTAQIVSAHASHNAVPAAALPTLIQDVHRTLMAIQNAPNEAPARPEPAVPIAKSITQDHIICLEDGKKMKMLKRHLKASFNLTPDQYRQRWGLPPDYPMVAPRYAKQRSTMAKKIGLGTKPGKRRAAAG